jgi:hypothetical protein
MHPQHNTMKYRRHSAEQPLRRVSVISSWHPFAYLTGGVLMQLARKRHANQHYGNLTMLGSAPFGRDGVFKYTHQNQIQAPAIAIGMLQVDNQSCQS